MTSTISSHQRLSPQPHVASDLIFSRQHIDEVNKNTAKEVTSTSQPPLCGLQIVHASTGRVRIRATEGSSNSILDTIAQELRQQDGVKDVSVNHQTGSLVVNFDENKLSLAQMLGVQPDYVKKQTQASPQSASKSDPFAEWKSLNFWKEQGISLIPLMVGLGLTRRLGISGFASIPVYLLSADATRRVIDFVGLQISAREQNKKSPVKDSSAKSTSDRKPVVKDSRTESNSDRKPVVKDSKTHQTTSSKAEDKSVISTAKQAKIAYKVVHEIPGRIRFHLPRLAQDKAYGRRLERLLKTDPQVTNVRINSDAASIAIAYKSQEITVSHWASLMELADKENPPTNTVKAPEPQPQPIVKPTEVTNPTKECQQSTVDVDSIWANFKSPAMSFSLNVMANLPLNPVPD
jgi:copper chaperone CopZ